MASAVFFIGSYTQPADLMAGHGSGITWALLDADAGKLGLSECHSGVMNPSYLDWDAKSRRLFSVSERYDEEGRIHAFSWSERGGLRELFSVRSRGLATCHLTSSAEKKSIYVAHYFSGKILHLDLDGVFRGELQFCGSGPFSGRQEQSHPHCCVVSPCSRWLYVCDLGADCIWTIELDAEGCFLGPPRPNSFPPGSGPRHLVMHPDAPWAYAVCELSGGLVALHQQDDGSLQLRQVLAIPGAGVESCAAIRLVGNQLLVSDREGGRLVEFELDARGEMHFLRAIDSGGKTPRDFNIDPSGAFLVVANQGSDSVCLIRRSDGAILDTLSVGSPACIIFGS
jgi:6-phosphogluconolactonase